MCGIAGILQNTNDTGCLHAIDAMRDSLAHRGPDDKGSWIDTRTGRIALGHRRLSVVDLSARGAQPMTSEDERYVIVFNGEIYNFRTLRKDLQRNGHAFRGTSDTEVALAAFLEWGVESALRRFEGMFAIALWDRQDECLYLARDRFGEKPLYYGDHNGVFLFGSELKALGRHPAFAPKIDRDALTLLLRYSYIPAPHCVFRHYHKLPPASYLCIDRNLRHGEPKTYWDIEARAVSPLLTELSDHEAVDELERLLSESIREKMVADVPVGAFLSGGVDSSLVVSLMRQFSSQPVRSFTIGFHDKKLNEAGDAAVTAKHLGTDHHELYVSESELMAVVPQLAHIYDEPFADPSQIPTFVVSQLAREHVTVALSGDGSDELFGGYPRYDGAIRRWHRTRNTPAPLRRLNAGYLRFKARTRKAKRARYLQLSRMQGHGRDLRQFYRTMMSYWLDPEHVVLDAREPYTPFLRDDRRLAASDPWRWLTATDAMCYLPEGIMTKVDRAAMAVSLETRAPFLDSRIAEFAFRLPDGFKYRGGVNKWLPRQLLYRHLPAQIVDRPKRGFGVPLAAWLRGPLRDWGETLLAPDRLREQGFFDTNLVSSAWQAHADGVSDWDWSLWSVLMFQAWLDDFFNNESCSPRHTVLRPSTGGLTCTG